MLLSWLPKGRGHTDWADHQSQRAPCKWAFWMSEENCFQSMLHNFLVNFVADYLPKPTPSDRLFSRFSESSTEVSSRNHPMNLVVLFIGPLGPLTWWKQPLRSRPEAIRFWVIHATSINFQQRMGENRESTSKCMAKIIVENDGVWWWSSSSSSSSSFFHGWTYHVCPSQVQPAPSNSGLLLCLEGLSINKLSNGKWFCRGRWWEFRLCCGHVSFLELCSYEFRQYHYVIFCHV